MEIVKEFNYSNLITDKQQKNAIQIVDKIIKSGNWVKSHPKFQTHPNLFLYDEFKIFKETFLYSCFKYINYEETLNYKIRMWVFRNNRFESCKKTNEKLWHKHGNIGDNQISGIYYLRNFRKEGTIFENFELKVKPYTWYLYPSHLLHRPPTIKSFRNRYTLAADFFY